MHFLRGCEGIQGGLDRERDGVRCESRRRVDAGTSSRRRDEADGVGAPQSGPPWISSQPLRIALLLAGCLAAALAALGVAAQPLTCPAAPAGRPCDVFHFHVQMFRPDTRAFTEIYAGPQFATQVACDRAREQQVAANQKVAGFFRDVKKQERYMPDRVGVCHCDMTDERSSGTYLNADQRVLQLRMAEEIRLRVRERLLDEKIATDSELMRALYSDPPSTPALGTPKLVPMPAIVAVPLVTAAEDLQPTRTLDTSKPTVAAMDLPLIDIGAASAPAVSEGEASPSSEAGISGPAPLPPAEEPPFEETRVEAQEAVEEIEDLPSEDEQQSVEETAERFISYETQRIQNVLRASSAIADENVKTKIFQACMERIQLLSNLRLLIEGSGMRSRLATAAREAQTEAQRLVLVAQLFGEGVKAHWAPSDASDVIFEIDPSVAAEPERALRDSTGRFTSDQKQQALYVVLAQTQPTEDQRLWLSAVVDGFLR